MIGDWKITYDTYKGIKYAISSRRTSEKITSVTPIIRDTRMGGYCGPGHFCAYVECEQEDARRLEDFAHGGYTWADDVARHADDSERYISSTEFPDGTEAAEGMVVVGWDYCHGGDYYWTNDEVFNEIKDFINELWKGKNVENPRLTHELKL